jgi:hypothetical protein
MLPDSASFVLASVAPLEGPYTEGMETYIEINLNYIKGSVRQNKNFQCWRRTCGNFIGG